MADSQEEQQEKKKKQNNPVSLNNRFCPLAEEDSENPSDKPTTQDTNNTKENKTRATPNND